MRTIIIVAMFSASILLGCGVHETYDRAYERGSNIRTMMTLRDAALGLEHYRVANGTYPRADDAAALRAILVPSYIETWTGLDKWGRPILVQCSESGYLLSSKGSDGKGEHEFEGAVEREGHSVTLQDGTFVQYAAIAESTARKYEQAIEAVRAGEPEGTEQEQAGQDA